MVKCEIEKNKTCKTVYLINLDRKRQHSPTLSSRPKRQRSGEISKRFLDYARNDTGARKNPPCHLDRSIKKYPSACEGYFFCLGNISPGVNVSAVNVDFKVAMRTRAIARASHLGNLLALCNLLTDAHRNS